MARKIRFPESYNGKNMAQGAPTEMIDARGNRLELHRDPQRNLQEIRTPHGHWIRFSFKRAFQGSTIFVIPLSLDHCKPGFDWAACAEPILHWCPLCLSDTVIGHGWRRKQAHDGSHDWIMYRRGLCNLCELTFSFLPAFSLPYTHFSLVARSEALRRRFVEHCSCESAAPPLKDPNRVPDPSTLRRWCRSLDSSPAFSFLRRTLEAVEQWLARDEQLARLVTLVLAHPFLLSATRLALAPAPLRPGDFSSSPTILAWER